MHFFVAVARTPTELSIGSSEFAGDGRRLCRLRTVVLIGYLIRVPLSLIERNLVVIAHSFFVQYVRVFF